MTEDELKTPKGKALVDLLMDMLYLKQVWNSTFSQEQLDERLAEIDKL